VNYRHRFHAGNVADVFKHLVLLELIEHLRAKDKAFCVIDSHAGSGLYRLESPGEFEHGIGRLWPVRQEWPQLAGYFAALAPFNRQRLHAYPGSPLLIAAQLRPQDRAVFLEMQPQEAALLRDNLEGVPHVTVQQADAWVALRGLLPPRENRGLVLIDPPYERHDEFAQAAAALKDGTRRWRNGIYAVWYPIKARRPVEQLHAEVRTLGLEAWAVELLTLPEDVPQRLNGSGVLIVNPPWKLREALEPLLRPLATWLAGPHGRPQLRFVGLGGDLPAT
jgi:23S rRNA (adenine2030-N6)-methyltransferase